MQYFIGVLNFKKKANRFDKFKMQKKNGKNKKLIFFFDKFQILYFVSGLVLCVLQLEIDTGSLRQMTHRQKGLVITSSKV